MTTGATNPKPTDPIRPLALELDILCRSRGLHGITALREDRDGRGAILGGKHYYDPNRASTREVGECRKTRSFIPQSALFLARIGHLFTLEAALVCALTSKYARELAAWNIPRALAKEEKNAALGASHTDPHAIAAEIEKEAIADEIEKETYNKAMREVLASTSLINLKTEELEQWIADLALHATCRNTSEINIVRDNGSINPTAAFFGNLKRLEATKLFQGGRAVVPLAVAVRPAPPPAPHGDEILLPTASRPSPFEAQLAADVAMIANEISALRQLFHATRHRA